MAGLEKQEECRSSSYVMWHGESERFAEKTEVTVEAASTTCPGTETVGRVESYEAETGKWTVFVHEEGRKVAVDEELLRLAYSVQPEETTLEVKRPPFCVEEKAQGQCGRGMKATRDVEQETELFSEVPYVVTRSDTENTYRWRWHAYLRLQMAGAAGAFDAMSPAVASEKLSEEAARVFDEATFEANLASKVSPEARAEFLNQRKAHVAQIAAVLGKFEANALPYGDDGSLAALFRFASRFNHSCVPNVIIARDWKPFTPGTRVHNDGRLVAYAACRIRQGEPLTVCYARPQFLTWPLRDRRLYLLQNHGFYCRCARCVAEELALKARASLRN